MLDQQYGAELEAQGGTIMATTQKIRIRLKAFDHNILDESAGRIVVQPKHRRRISGRFPSTENHHHSSLAAQT